MWGWEGHEEARLSFGISMVTCLVLELSGHDIEVSSRGLITSPTGCNTECKSEGGGEDASGYLFKK